jgi:hypothetical protein
MINKRLHCLVGLALFSASSASTWCPTQAQGWRASGTKVPGQAESSMPLASGGEIQLVSSDSSEAGLPDSHGQVWADYDLRPFTERYPQMAQPQQSVVDWVLRETGTESWFSEAAAVLCSDRSTLRVYHSPSIQAVVEETVRRFVRPENGEFHFAVRLVTITSPNWRSKALPRLHSVTVQTPGVEAWLLSREDAALVYSDLRKRSDFREHNSPNLLIPNGHTHEIARRRPLAYVKSVSMSDGYGGHRLEPGQVEEGFSVNLSPLLSATGDTIDAVIRLETSQVEKLTTVSVPLAGSGSSRQATSIQVPQTSGWRLHERFRWPVKDVLLISCGVVAIPDGENAPIKLPLINRQPPRADALLFVEAKGVSAELPAAEAQAARASSWNFRGRY